MIEYTIGLFVFNIIGFCYLFNHFTSIYENQFDITDKILKHIQKDKVKYENQCDITAIILKHIQKDKVKPARTDEYNWSSINLGLDSEE